MRKINLVLLILLLLMIVFSIYFVQGGNLRSKVYVSTQSGWENPEAFESIRNILNSGAAPQTFDALPEDVERCSTMDITLRLTNVGLFAAEWIDIALEPQAGDIAVYSLEGEGATVPARSSLQINLKLVTAQPAGQRVVRLNYYVYGMQKTIRIKV
ncbi:MAG: hypothetical protein IJ074_08465 [Clostridia bacterium]|nr:hypothetical protein [Clostridia bacterium]